MPWDHLITSISTFWHLWGKPMHRGCVEVCCVRSLSLKLVFLWCFSNYKLALTCILLLEHTKRSTLLRGCMLLLSEQTDGAKSCLARSLNSVVMATETSWQLECISFGEETSARALCIYSRCLFTINGHKYLYGLEDISTAEESRRPAASGDMSWWSGLCHTSVTAFSCVEAQVHLSVPFNLKWL